MQSIYKTLTLATALAMSLAMSVSAAAQTAASGSTASIPAVGAMTAPSDITEGEVRKLSKDTGKLTIKHGPIKNLDMPPMTMVFTVKDLAMLDKVAVGDKIRFVVVEQDGQMVVTELQPAK